MATKKTPYEAPAPASDKKKALQTALSQLDKAYGKGTVMRLGDRPETVSYTHLTLPTSNHV